MVKPSKVQQEILEKMASGWQLGRSSSGYDGRAWLQRGGCGYGGESRPVNMGTLKAMENHGYIVKDIFKFPTQTYRLNADIAAIYRPFPVIEEEVKK